jgi:acetaldehyde dehydrogenase/alcohol dehydrogenase
MLWLRTPEKVYFKKGCMPVALRELGAVYGKKRAFIVTDQFLFKSGFTKKIEASLDEQGIAHSSFWNVAPDPTLQSALEGLTQLNAL